MRPSGRYRCEKLRRHWSQNQAGTCELEPCYKQSITGSLEHLLLDCEGLRDCRAATSSLWETKLNDFPEVKAIFRKYILSGKENTIQLLLDPSILPEVISLKQLKRINEINIVFYLTRTFATLCTKQS